MIGLTLTILISSLLLPKIILGNNNISCELEKTIINANWKIYSILFVSYSAVGCCVFILLSINTIISDKFYPSYYEFVFLKQKTVTVLNIVGIIITASTIATALVKAIINNTELLSIEMVYAYGVFNTLYIALIFLPISFRLSAWGRDTINAKLINKRSLSNDSELLLKQKESYEKLYELDHDYINILKQAIPILAPLLSSLLDYTQITPK